LEKLIDDLVVIDKGQIVYTQSMAALENGGKKLLVLKTSDDAKAKDVLSQNGYELNDADNVNITEKADTKMADIIKLLSDNGIDIDDVQHIHSDLETSLLELLKNDKVKES
jgi:ABC-2 type transport system ATP-binding protein